jgi:hypothetical protein
MVPCGKKQCRDCSYFHWESQKKDARGMGIRRRGRVVGV